jgi:hypothetical protein
MCTAMARPVRTGDPQCSQELVGGEKKPHHEHSTI